MRYVQSTVRTDSLRPGYRGATIDFTWKPYAERRGEDRQAFDALRENIREHGIRHPLVTYRGRVLIGMRRWEIARELGVEFVAVVEILDALETWRIDEVRRLREWLRAQGWME